MREVGEHVQKARRSLDSGAYLLGGGFIEEAGREGYMAAFHAALAYIVTLTSREPKTHGGTHTEFARLVHQRADLPQEYVSFLSQAYEMKSIADYENTRPVSIGEAQAALATAATLLEAVLALAPSDSTAAP